MNGGVHFDRSARNGFSVNALDRRSEKRADPAVLAEALADRRAAVMLFNGGRILLDRATAVPGLFDLARAGTLGAAMAEPLLLGWAPDGAPRFAAEVAGEPAEADGLALVDLRSLALDGLAGDDLFGPAAQARSLLGWHERHRFCGGCGTGTVMALAGYRRDCPACGLQHFPRVDPVVIMLVSHEGRALLGRQPQFRTGSYSCLAGFVEPGETIEDAVRRETFEEAGIRVGAVAYRSSQPWPFVSSLMIGCRGEALDATIVMDAAELEDCRWFAREEVAAMLAGSHPDGLFCPPKLAIARRLIEDWATGDE